MNTKLTGQLNFLFSPVFLPKDSLRVAHLSPDKNSSTETCNS